MILAYHTIVAQARFWCMYQLPKAQMSDDSFFEWNGMESEVSLNAKGIGVGCINADGIYQGIIGQRLTSSAKAIQLLVENLNTRNMK